MGYLVQYRYGTLEVKADLTSAALAALHDLVARPDFAGVNGAGLRHRVLATSTVQTALAAFGWHSATNGSGDVQALRPRADELGESEALLQALTPLITPGGFVEFVGEDGDVWRWTFTGGHMIETYPQLTWPPATRVELCTLGRLRRILTANRRRRRTAP